MGKIVSLVLLMAVSNSSFAYSLSEIHDCVTRSKGDGSNTYAIAEQCSGVVNVDVLRDCVDQVRHLDGFIMPLTAKVCAGVKNVKLLRDCITKEKSEDAFDDEEVAVLCNQKGT